MYLSKAKHLHSETSKCKQVQHHLKTQASASTSQAISNTISQHQFLDPELPGRVSNLGNNSNHNANFIEQLNQQQFKILNTKLPMPPVPLPETLTGDFDKMVALQRLLEPYGICEDINEEWISDKTRFCYDGLKRQRLNDPMIRGPDGRFKSVSWRDVLAAVAEVVRHVKPEEIVGVAGKLSDADSMMALEDFVNKMGSNNMWCEGNGSNPQADLRSCYLMNSHIASLEKADLFLVVGSQVHTVLKSMHIDSRERSNCYNSDLACKLIHARFSR